MLLTKATHCITVFNRIAKALTEAESFKADKLRKQADLRMQSLTRTYMSITSCMGRIIQSSAQAVSRINTIITESDFKGTDGASIVYANYQSHLYEIVHHSNKFMEYINLCISFVSSQDEYMLTDVLNNMCTATVNLLKDYGEL